MSNGVKAGSESAIVDWKVLTFVDLASQQEISISKRLLLSMVTGNRTVPFVDEHWRQWIGHVQRRFSRNHWSKNVEREIDKLLNQGLITEDGDGLIHLTEKGVKRHSRLDDRLELNAVTRAEKLRGAVEDLPWIEIQTNRDEEAWTLSDKQALLELAEQVDDKGWLKETVSKFLGGLEGDIILSPGSPLSVQAETAVGKTQTMLLFALERALSGYRITVLCDQNRNVVSHFKTLSKWCMKLEEAGVKNVPVVSELTGFSWYDRNNPYTPINRPRVDISIEDDDVDQVPITESVDWFWGTRKDHFCIRKLPPEVKPKGRTQIGPSRGFPCMTPETDDDVPRCPHLDKCGLFRKDFEAANADILITNFHVYFNSSFRHPVAILESEGICHEAYLPNAAPVKRVIETGFDAVFVDEADATKSAVESKLVAKLSQRDASITAGILLDPKFIDAVSRFISDQTGDTDENARKRAKRRVERLTRVLLSLIHRVVTISADQETMGYNPGALHIDDRVRTWGELLPKEQLKAIAQPFTVNPSEEELEGVRIALASIDPHRMAIRRDLGRIQLSRLEAMAIAEGVRIFPEEMRKRLETVLYNFIVPLSSRFDFPLDRFGVDYYLSSPREGTERTLALVKSDPELTIRWHWTDVDAPRVWLLSATGNYRSASVTYIHWPRRMSHTAPRITAEHLQVIACKSTLSISGSNKDERYKLFRSMAEPLFDLVEKLTSNEENPGILVACPSYESVTALRDGFDDGYRDERRWRSLTSREGPLSIFLEDKAEKERLLSGLGERSPRILIAPIASIYRGHNWIDDEMNSLFNVIIMPTFNFQPPYTAEVVHVNRSRELMKLFDRWKSENRGSDSEPPLLRWRGKLMTFKEENELYRTYLVSNIVPALVQLIGRALRNENDRLSLVLLDSAGFENKRIQQLAERIEDAECPSPGLADAMKDEHLITVDLPEEAAEIILAHTLPKGKDSILKEVVS